MTDSKSRSRPSPCDAMAAMYKRIEDLHRDLVNAAAQIRTGSPQALADEDLVDCGFMLREMARLLDDAKKAAGATSMLIGKIIYMRVSRTALETGEMKMRGRMATAIPDVQVKPQVPRVGTPPYRQMLLAFGVPEVTIAQGVLTFKFVALSEALTKMAMEGKNPPAMTTWSDYSCVFRRAKVDPHKENGFTGSVADATDDIGGNDDECSD